MVASALVHGSVRLSAFGAERLADPATRALMQRIDKALDPEIDAAFPGRRAARVEVTLRDGRQFTHLQSDRKGDPELPLSDAELGDKLIELASPSIGTARARDAARRALDAGREQGTALTPHAPVHDAVSAFADSGLPAASKGVGWRSPTARISALLPRR